MVTFWRSSSDHSRSRSRSRSESSHRSRSISPAPLLEDVVIGAPEIVGLDLDLLLDPIETTIRTATEIEVAMKIAADPDTDLQTHQVD